MASLLPTQQSDVHTSKNFGENGLWEITPQLACKWLEKMGKNRASRPIQVQRFVRIMQERKWHLNGETIKFNEHGELFDGQHRLKACVESNITFLSYVIFNVSMSAQDTVDIGLRRSPGDVFTLSGYTNGTNVAAVVRWIWRYNNNMMVQYTGYTAPTVHTLLSYFEKHQDVINSMKYWKTHNHLTLPSLFVAIHYLCFQQGSIDADKFFDQLLSGENLTKDNPIFALRRRLLDNRQAKAKLPEYEIAALIIKAWNAYRKGKPLQVLTWRHFGEKPEPFPTIQ